jgi:hypothetical protein
VVADDGRGRSQREEKYRNGQTQFHGWTLTP